MLVNKQPQNQQGYIIKAKILNFDYYKIILFICFILQLLTLFFTKNYNSVTIKLKQKNLNISCLFYCILWHSMVFYCILLYSIIFYCILFYFIVFFIVILKSYHFLIKFKILFEYFEWIILLISLDNIFRKIIDFPSSPLIFYLIDFIYSFKLCFN